MYANGKMRELKKYLLWKVVELLIPCILHLENQTGEKTITIILWKGMDLFQGAKDQYIRFFEEAF